MSKQYPQFVTKLYWIHLIEPLRPLKTVISIGGSDDLEKAIKDVKALTQEYINCNRYVIIRIAQEEFLKVLFMAIVNRDTVEYFDYRDEKEQS